MNYKELLNRTIKRSGLKNVELIERLKEMGVSITPNYLSVLRNEDNKIASVEKSKAIAKVCGEPEELLVVQADLDNLSGYLKEYVSDTIKKSMDSARIGLTTIDNAEEKKKAEDKLNAMCEADFICEYITNKSYYDNTLDDFLNIIKDGFVKGQLKKQKYAIVPLAYDGNIKIVDDISTLKE